MAEHISQEQAERYCLGEISGDALASCETHLLACGECRTLVAEADSFVLAMRTAAAKLRAQGVRRPARGWVFRILVPAFAALALATVWITPRRGPAVSVPLAVELRVDRGPSDAHATSGAPLSLRPDLRGLPVGIYNMELVDAQGRLQWRRTNDFRSVAKVDSEGLDAGTYFVRLYSPDKELRREYALIVDPR